MVYRDSGINIIILFLLLVYFGVENFSINQGKQGEKNNCECLMIAVHVCVENVLKRKEWIWAIDFANENRAKAIFMIYLANFFSCSSYHVRTIVPWYELHGFEAILAWLFVCALFKNLVSLFLQQYDQRTSDQDWWWLMMSGDKDIIHHCGSVADTLQLQQLP